MCRWVTAVFAVLTVYCCQLHCRPQGLLTSHTTKINDRPIIGVLAQENLPYDEGATGSSYIASSYVSYLEAAGTRVIPIRINLTEEEYTKLFYSINGVLLPGGDVNIETSQFTRTAKIFYNLALEANDKGDHFPIWGTCQGLQQLSVFTANQNLLTRTETRAVALPLTFTKEAQSSRLFANFPMDLMQDLAEENITANFHRWSLSVQNYSQSAELRGFYKVLSTNNDGITEFISTMEAINYPFYAVQWHPERTPYEWIDKPGMVHSTAAVRASFYTGLFFVSEAKKNHHRFSDPEEEERALIYNFSPVFKGTQDIFVQTYYFV